MYALFPLVLVAPLFHGSIAKLHGSIVIPIIGLHNMVPLIDWYPDELDII